MKPFFPLLLLFCMNIFAQPEGQIAGESPVTLVYKITDRQAGKLYRNGKAKIGEDMLKHCTDTFPGHKEYLPEEYPYGHYLLVTARSNFLDFRLQSAIPFEHRMLNNQRDMSLKVFDKRTGREISNAKVKIGNKRLRFDDKTQSYRKRKTDKKGILSIEVEAMTAYYTVTRQHNLNWWKRAKSGLWNAPVVKYVSRPVLFVTSIPTDSYLSFKNGHTVGSIYYIQKPFSDIYRSIRYGYPHGFINKIAHAFDKNDYYQHESFMVFSKPKYRPGDTVRLKAFIADKKGNPVKDSLELSIHTEKKHHISYLKPYRPGFFAMEFIPKESYGMKLDKRYTVRLSNKKTDLVFGNFYYEDYELKSVQYDIRGDKPEYLSHEEVVFYAKATDDNNMPLPDARVELMLTSEKIVLAGADLVVVPKELWKKELNLDPIGETKIVVPAGIWPDAVLGVKATASFSNSDNQSGIKPFFFTRKNIAQKLVITQHSDSLYFRLEDGGEPVTGRQAFLKRSPYPDTILSLPAKIRIDPLVGKYEALAVRPQEKYLPIAGQPDLFFKTMERTRSQPAESFVPSENNSGIGCIMERINDSIYIAVDNPYGIPLNYTVYRKNKELKRGSGQLTGYHVKTSPKDYFLSVQYIWGGKEHQGEYRYNGNTGNMVINTALPQVIVPGQNLEIDIAVSDGNNKPLPDVDLTAWGYTSKFGDQNLPNIPGWQKPPTYRKSFNSFTSVGKTDQGRKRELDYPQWRDPLRLDSTEIYHFAYPGKEMYHYSFPSSDGKTYIAPYLVHDGKLLPVQILYINDKPVYFNKTTTDMPYVFEVKDTWFSLCWRANNREITARMDVVQGQKNIISIDPYLWDRKIIINGKHLAWGEIKKRENKFDFREQQLMRNYLLPLRYQNNRQIAYLKQENRFEIIFPSARSYHRNVIAGPFDQNGISLWEEDWKVLSFDTDRSQWFEYEPLPGILKMRTVDFDNSFPHKPPTFGWKTEPYSKIYIDSLVRVTQISRLRNIRRHLTKHPDNGTLQLDMQLDKTQEIYGWCWILYDYTHHDTYFYPLTQRTFQSLPEGLHALFLLMADKTYYLQDSIPIQADATTMLRFEMQQLQRSSQPIDSLVDIRPLLKEVADYSGLSVTVPPYRKIDPEPVRYNPAYAGSVRVCGTITDETGEFLPGVNVIVKGTTIGVVTDINGDYCIDIPEGYRKLIFTFIGYEMLEATPLSDGALSLEMKESVLELEELVVVGYGTQKKSNLTGSISAVKDVSGSLSGRVAGVTIRGTGSLSGARPLYIVDGVIVNDLSSVPEGDIADMQVLKDAAATALYGARAANGVVVITTKGKSSVIDAREIVKELMEDEAYQTGLASAKGLRTNFSDEAFWQPVLTTDKNGVATFRTTFPDDVTKWDIRFIGMLPGKASAVKQTQVRSFKPLMGQLSLPRFMVEGDTANVIGKITNYTQDSIRLQTSFSIGGEQQTARNTSILHSQIDTLSVVAPEAGLQDSISARYMLTREDGYQDGEERFIPLIQQGTTEHTGQFHVLDTDTLIHLSFDAVDSPVTLSLENHALDIVMKEARYLRNYRHLCNEQSASRLKSMLLERKVSQLQGEKYKFDKQINGLIRQILKGRNDQRLWGWFGNNETEVWISTHAAETLLQAKADGFEVDADFDTLRDRLIQIFDVNSDAEKIRLLNILLKISAKSNYRDLYEKINPKELKFYTDSINWMELGLHFGEKPDMERVMKRKQTDRLGNIHWKENDSGYWRYGDVSATLAVYRLLRATGGYERELGKIRNYLYYRRGNMCWINTYESANILSVIVPDLLAADVGKGKPEVKIEGTYTTVVDTFPKRINLTGSGQISIRKSGVSPIYLTVSQEKRIANPESENKGFRVETRFKDGNTSLPKFLTAGKSVTLEVEITSDISSEYVLIDIPIPAGCSYQSKSQSWYWRYGETHREYFRDRVSIYMRRMEKGTHKFEIELMPRFTGTYHVNPAKAERMYMPLYYGRTGVKKLRIKN